MICRCLIQMQENLNINCTLICYKQILKLLVKLGSVKVSLKHTHLIDIIGEPCLGTLFCENAALTF